MSIARIVIRHLLNHIGQYGKMERYREATALTAEQTGEKGKTMSRSIDADALMNKIGKVLSEHLTIGVVATEIIDAVKDAPTIEPKQGVWVNSEGFPITDKYSVYCDQCGNWSEYRTDYCPNCGARMKGADNE